TMRTSAPATKAPLGSNTVPVIAPVAPPCASTCAAQISPNKLMQNILPNDLRIHSSPMSVSNVLNATKAVGQNLKGQAAQPPWLVPSRRLQPLPANPTQDRLSTTLMRYTLPPRTIPDWNL